MVTRRFRKQQINREGSQPGSFEENTNSGHTRRSYEVVNKSGNVGQGNDVENIHTGPGNGTGIGIRDPESPPVKGFSTETGSKVIISNSAGGEVIELHHPTGAQFIIDADGSIHVMPSSKKGFGLVSDKGNGTIYVKGDLLLKGDSKVFVETPGTFEINAGDMYVNVEGDYITTVKGSMQTVVDGTWNMEVTKDYNQIIAGQRRTTVAGDSREQISGVSRHDIGQELDYRVDQQASISSEKALNLFSGTQMNFNASEEFTLSGAEEVILQSQKSVGIIGNENVDIEGKDGIYSRTNSQYVISSKGAVNIDSDNSITTRSSNIRFDADSTFVVRSEASEIHSDNNMDIRSNSMLLNSSEGMEVKASSYDLDINGALAVKSTTANIDSSGAMDIRGSTIDLNPGAPASPGSPLNPTSYVPKETTDAKTASPPDPTNTPEYVEVDVILENATTEHFTPETARFPNGKRMSREEFSYYEHQSGSVPQETRSAAYENFGAVPESDYSDDSEIAQGSTLDPNLQTGNNTSVAKEYPGEILSNLNNANAKLSRHITCGMFTGVFRNARSSGETTPQVMRNIHNLCYNILDPLWEKYGSRGIRITSGLRRANRDRRGSKHFTGEAADIQLSSAANAALHAELAAWVRDHLPYQAILLEVTGKRNLIVHLESLQPGNRSTRGSGSRPVLTCADIGCNISTPGISTKVARRYQRR